MLRIIILLWKLQCSGSKGLFNLLGAAEWTQTGNGEFDIWEDVLCETGQRNWFRTRAALDKRTQTPDTGQVYQSQGLVLSFKRQPSP